MYFNQRPLYFCPSVWLGAKGYQYLTDALPFLSKEGYIIPLVRPVNLTVYSNSSDLYPEFRDMVAAI